MSSTINYRPSKETDFAAQYEAVLTETENLGDLSPLKHKVSKHQWKQEQKTAKKIAEKLKLPK